MKKTLSLSLFFFCLFSWLAAPAISESADDVLNKMIDALGGRKALEGIEDATMTGTMELTQMGLSATVTSYRKNPNKTRMDIEVMGMVITQAFDGQTAWMVNPQTGSSEELPEQFAEYSKRDSLGDAAYLDPKKYGITYTLKEKESIEGKEYLVLEQAFADGYIATLYVDPKTYLVYKSKGTALNQMQVEVEQETVQMDYKKINGMMVPHTVTIFQDGEEFGVMTIAEVKYNSGLEDSFFEMQ
ncbi:MAG: outer membrane lipoprotein-sorting protein [Candidatus Aminicenantes bacterium]|nr:outer membrane lipoprotein-sorting protein [Candidatus Aminicenantes bacterium]